MRKNWREREDWLCCPSCGLRDHYIETRCDWCGWGDPECGACKGTGWKFSGFLDCPCGAGNVDANAGTGGL